MFRNYFTPLRNAISLTFLVLNLISHPLVALANKPATPFIPTHLAIPAIALDSAIVSVGIKEVEVNGQTYYQWLTDDNLVGWHNLSAPMGQAGNTVLNGHSNIHAQVFQALGNIAIGDEIIVYSGDQAYRYVVAEKLLVQEKSVSLEQRIKNAQIIMPTQDERLTLITCSQSGATHRLIVIARRVP